jgi:uncharacterized membrane protein YgcG
MNRDQDRNAERSGGGSETTSVMQLLVEMARLPLMAFVYGVEMVVRTMQGIQRMADEGIDVMVGRANQTRVDAQGGPSVARGEAAGGGDQTTGGASGGWGELTSSAVSPTTRGSLHGGTETNNKEEKHMRDRNLSDDMLKLVRFKILFVMRDYEVAFPEQEELVYDNIDDTALTAWKIAEFIQNLDTTPVPRRWRDKNYPPGAAGGMVMSLPEDDKKYLRLYYEVLDRYPRERLYYEDRQLEVLEDIADALRRNNPPSTSGTTSATASTGTSTGTSGGTSTGTGGGTGGGGTGGQTTNTSTKRPGTNT